MSFNLYLDPRPLVDIARRTCRRTDGTQTDDKPTDRDLAIYFGVSLSTITKWRNGHRNIDIFTADRHANSLGLHPLNVWPDDWPLDYPDEEHNPT